MMNSNVSIDFSKATERKLDQYFNARMNADDLPLLDYSIFKTAAPMSVSYKDAIWDNTGFVPTLLRELCDELDERIPPLRILSANITAVSVRNCDDFLNALLQAKDDAGFRRTCLSATKPDHLAQTVILFLLRLERPPMIAKMQLCDMLYAKGHYVNPRRSSKNIMCSLKNNVSFVLHNCLKAMTIYQRATACYFFQHCQRWCQTEVGYALKMDRTEDASVAYSNALRLIGNLFSNSFIELPARYVFMGAALNELEKVESIRIEIFSFLVGCVGYNVWHANSLEALMTIKSKCMCEERGGCF